MNPRSTPPTDSPLYESRAMTDPFEHFGEQQLSFELLEEHREQLAQNAARIVSDNPDAQPVGVILDADASEAAELRRHYEQQTGQPVERITLILPREAVLEVVRANAPHTLDFLEPATEGRHRRLPLVAITKNGYRYGAIDYEVPL